MTIREELVEKFESMCPGSDGDGCETCPFKECAVCNKAERELTDADYEETVRFMESEKDPYREMKERFINADKETEEIFADFDVVNRPAHYTKTSIECIDAMVETQGTKAVVDFCVCNAFKYLWRHNSKNGDEDIKKANWYLNKAVEIMER